MLSGALFITIGVLFLRFDGTAGSTGLFGDTTNTERATNADSTSNDHGPSEPDASGDPSVEAPRVHEVSAAPR